MFYLNLKRKITDTLKSDIQTKNSDFWVIASKCLILGLLMLLSLFWNGFVYITLLFALLFSMTQTNGRGIYYVLFLLPLISIFRNTKSDLYFLTYVIAGVCLVLGIKLFFEVFIKKTKKVNWYFIGALSIMTIYFLARANFDNISLVLSLMIGVVLIFVVYNYKDDMSL